MSRFRKTYAAAVAAVTATLSILWDVRIDQGEAIQLVAIWSGVGAVWLFPNDDDPDVDGGDQPRDQAGRFTRR